MSQPDRPASAAEGLVNHQKYNDHVPTASPEAVAVLHRSSTGAAVLLTFIVGAPYRVALVAVKRCLALRLLTWRSVSQGVTQMSLNDEANQCLMMDVATLCLLLELLKVVLV